MSLGLIVYLISLADTAKWAFGVGSLLFACIAFAIAFCSVMDAAPSSKVTVLEIMERYKFKVISIAFVVCSVFYVIIPDKETSYVIVAATGVDILVDSGGVQRIAGKSMEVVEKQLDMYLNAGKVEETGE